MAKKYYEVQQINATGNGHSTTLAIVVDPVIKEGAIHATQVGEWDCCFHPEINEYMYRHCEPVDFIIIGNATCVERKHPFSDLNVD